MPHLDFFGKVHIRAFLTMRPLADRVRCAMNKMFKEKDLDITSSQARLLAFLYAMGEQGVSQKEIEAFMYISHTTATLMVGRLVEKCYVEFAFDNAKDKRIKRISLTPAGLAIGTSFLPIAQHVEEILMQGLSPEEQEAYGTLIYKILENAEKLP